MKYYDYSDRLDCFLSFMPFIDYIGWFFIQFLIIFLAHLLINLDWGSIIDIYWKMGVWIIKIVQIFGILVLKVDWSTFPFLYIKGRGVIFRRGYAV